MGYYLERLKPPRQALIALGVLVAIAAIFFLGRVTAPKNKEIVVGGSELGKVKIQEEVPEEAELNLSPIKGQSPPKGSVWLGSISNKNRPWIYTGGAVAGPYDSGFGDALETTMIHYFTPKQAAEVEIGLPPTLTYATIQTDKRSAKEFDLIKEQTASYRRAPTGLGVPARLDYIPHNAWVLLEPNTVALVSVGDPKDLRRVLRSLKRV